LHVEVGGSVEKPSAEIIALFERVLPLDSRIEPRKMFGCPCAFVNGQLFTGVYEQSIMVRLGADQRSALLKEPNTGPFQAMGRTMREYVVFTNAAAIDPAILRTWIEHALHYACGLPPKAAKSRKPAARSTRTRSE